MKPRLYLETTIPSYLVAKPSQAVVVAGQQIITHWWWDQRSSDFEIYISQVVLDEISAGDHEMARRRTELVRPFTELKLTEEVATLAKSLLRGGPLPQNAGRDAAHIAVAAVHGMHFLLTWNCRHIANAEILPIVETICERHGYRCPIVCTPSELMGI